MDLKQHQNVPLFYNDCNIKPTEIEFSHFILRDNKKRKTQSRHLPELQSILFVSEIWISKKGKNQVYSRHFAPNLDFLKSDVGIKTEMQIFDVASRADMDL